MHFRILTMITTSDFLTALNRTKFVFGRVLGKLTVLPRPINWLKGPYF